MYYPLSSLNNIFSSQDNVYEMDERLKKLSEYTNETLGEVIVSNKDDRFCFYINEQGAEYVHENTKEDEFIKRLIELVGKHETNMQDIENLFLEKSSKVHIEKWMIMNSIHLYILRMIKMILIITALKMKDSI